MPYFIVLAFTFAAAAVGGAASAGAPQFYGTLDKPAWAPPAWLFGPVWTVLYVLMAIAAILVWHKAGWAAARLPLSLYFVQLVLNALWTWIFFAWRSGGWALAEICMLWLMIVVVALLFWRIKPLSGWLMVPYLLWVTYAGALTASLWQMNRSLL